MKERSLLAALVCLGAAVLSACEEPAPSTSGAGSGAPSTRAPASVSAAVTAAAKPLPPMPKADPLPATPQPLPELKTPADNALTPEKAALGKQLFFDKRLSKDGTASCENCHYADKGWTDAKALSTKVGGAVNTRHTPTLWNVGYQDLWYWDGRSETLEKQVLAAWEKQMGGETAAVAAVIAKIPEYQVQFQTIFKQDPSGENIVKALASFVRTLRSGDSPWDKYEKGDKKAVGEDAVRGFELFRNKAGCAACHAPPMYTDNAFHNTGIGYDKTPPDLGRGAITKEEKDNGAFKTPTLRSVTTSGPYFHDGRAATIEEAIDYMLSGGIKDKNPNLDAKLKPVKLSAKERTDLIAFVKALEAPAQPFTAPKIP
jgi:cytochrome c peroxidase